MKSKRYNALRGLVSPDIVYGFKEACDLLVRGAQAHGVKFVESLDVSVNLNLGQKYSVRDSVLLPHCDFMGERRVLVFARGEKFEEARNAGAAHVGGQDLVKQIEGGWFDFDVVVATPDMMKDIGKLGPILGRRGLMPNVKLKTITFDIKNVVQEFKRGRSFFKSDKAGVVHFKIGNVQMSQDNLVENAKVLYRKILECKPQGLKGVYVKSTFVSSTMGVGCQFRHDSL